MKTIYRNILTVIIVMTGCCATAQTLNSAYFTDDYKYRHMLNPAMGNEQGYVSLPALGNISIKLSGNFGYQDVIMHNPMYPSQSGKKMTTFMNLHIRKRRSERLQQRKQPHNGRHRADHTVGRIQGFRRIQHLRDKLQEHCGIVAAVRTVRVCQEHRQQDV